MPKGIDKSPLAVAPPRRGMVSNRIGAADCARCQCSRDKRIRIVAKNLDASCRDANLGGTLPAVILGLADKEWGTGNFETDDRAHVPQHNGAESPPVPSDGRLRVRHCNHDRNMEKRWGLHSAVFAYVKEVRPQPARLVRRSNLDSAVSFRKWIRSHEA